MPALGFKTQFAPMVADGRKPHTIRAWRRRPFRKGDDLSFFTGMRTKACRRLRANAVCLAATPIEVDSVIRCVHLEPGSVNYPREFASMLFPEEIERLAKADGFESAYAFFAFFAKNHGPIVYGQLIEWKP